MVLTTNNYGINHYIKEEGFKLILVKNKYLNEDYSYIIIKFDCTH